MDYDFKTSFWSDFTIADHFGINSIQDTFNRAFKEWKNDIQYITEMAIVLNWKSWQWVEKDEAVAKLYTKLWEEVDKYCLDNFKEEDLKYYLRETD